MVFYEMPWDFYWISSSRSIIPLAFSFTSLTACFPTSHSLAQYGLTGLTAHLPFHSFHSNLLFTERMLVTTNLNFITNCMVLCTVGLFIFIPRQVTQPTLFPYVILSSVTFPVQMLLFLTFIVFPQEFLGYCQLLYCTAAHSGTSTCASKKKMCDNLFDQLYDEFLISAKLSREFLMLDFLLCTILHTMECSNAFFSILVNFIEVKR